MPTKLVIIYGPPLAGKTTIAWEVARTFSSKTAVLSADSLIKGSIAVPDLDQRAELEMTNTQLRLLSANYLKNAYNLVVEGPFRFERGGDIYDFESEIDQLIALMRHLTEQALIVRLTVSDATLASRASSSNRMPELPSAQRIKAAYKGRYGPRFLTADTDNLSPEQIASAVHEAFNSGVA